MQYGVLAWREGLAGTEVLLMTSRETGRWVVPKGWPMPQKKPYEAAEREAFEEAGVKGTVGETPIGSYSYRKRLRTGQYVPCEVQLFPMRVEKESRKWPEFRQRTRAWFSAERAAQLVDEPDLASLIRTVAG
jgi:8-oxo-dGTP pyrophosphatase MutT (NUDIX family)